MTDRLDAIVVGLGAAGSAALYHLSRRGARVAGFDAFSPPHALGSSHGETRMIRESYYEDPRYVPLVRRAYELWHELAASAGETLIVETGGVFAGPAGGELVSGIRRSARDHHIAIETLAATERASRFPWLSPARDMVVLTEARAGFLYPERCIAAHLRAAAGHGAIVRTNEQVLRWSTSRRGVKVETARGDYTAGRLALCTGAWMTATLAEAGVQAMVTRQPLFWFQTSTGATVPGCVWAIEFTPGKLLYGFPDTGSGLKVAIHYGGSMTTADTIDRVVKDEEVREVEELLARYLPDISATGPRTTVCMYTNTPDLHFVIDSHPAHPEVLLVSACSGHGFKFASAIGEAAAQWALDGAPKVDLSLFAFSRFR